MLALKRYIDGFVISGLFFFFFLIFLFIYLTKTHANNLHYNKYQYHIQKLTIADYKIESFLLEVYQTHNYDDITKTINDFEETMEFFKQSSIREEFGEVVYRHFDAISTIFGEKHRVVEKFKSLNSRLASSIHYMYDTKTTILMDDESPETKALLNSVFFQLGRISTAMDTDLNAIENDLNRLEANGQSAYFKYFSRHAKRFIQDSVHLENELALSKHIPLRQRIKALQELLLEKYNQNLFKERVVAFLLLIISFILLFLLFLNNKKVVQVTRKLLSFRYAIENSDNIIMMTDVNDKIEYVNDEFEKVTGYGKFESIGKKSDILQSDLMPKKFYTKLYNTLRAREKWEGKLVNKKKDGTLFYEQASIMPMFSQERLVGFLSIKRDITSYVEQQKKLKLSSTVFENTQDGILILDKKGTILSANNAVVKMSGYLLDELLGTKLTFLSPTLNLNVDKLWKGKILLVKADETSLPVWLMITAVYEKKKIVNLIAIYTDLSEIIRTQKKADFLTYHDSLTLLPNRLNFERAMEVACTNIGTNNLAVMMLGFNKLSFINDSLGYAVGDKLLVNFTEILADILPSDAVLGRWDGNKFIILLSLNQVDVTLLAKQIIKLINIPIVVSKHRLNVTLNIGISFYTEGIKEAKTLINYADLAMHRARGKGSNNYEYYSEDIYINLKGRLIIEAALQDALSKDEFVLNYQPQYDIKTKKVTGVETLIRWNNKKLGWVAPDDFLYIAEENGMIIELGFFIFEEACKAYMRWQALGIHLNTIAINVSGIQFKDKQFLNRIKSIINTVGIDPSAVEIELTESYIIDNSYKNLQVLNALRELGCQIAIDDFGTGYSSMSYLKELPINIVKIDRCFINELSTNKYDKTVSKAIISLAHSLGYKVIAEGIETIEQEALLEKYTCDIGQGYFFSKPLEEYKLIEFILESNK